MNKYCLKLIFNNDLFFEFEFYAFDEIEARKISTFIVMNRSNIKEFYLFRQNWTRLK